jgi:hypothetical protein
MGARLRRNGKAGVVSMLVALALVASAWLAYATTAPNGTPSYPGTTTTTAAPTTTTTTTITTTTTTTTVPATTTTTVAKVPFRAKGKGSCANQANSQFNFDVKAAGGALHTQVGQPGGVQFQASTADLLSFTVGGNTATFSFQGRLYGPGTDSTRYIADVTVTDNPDTWQISIEDEGGTVLYTASCAASNGAITFAYETAS